MSGMAFGERDDSIAHRTSIVDGPSFSPMVALTRLTEKARDSSDCVLGDVMILTSALMKLRRLERESHSHERPTMPDIDDVERAFNRIALGDLYYFDNQDGKDQFQTDIALLRRALFGGRT